MKTIIKTISLTKALTTFLLLTCLSCSLPQIVSPKFEKEVAEVIDDLIHSCDFQSAQISFQNRGSLRNPSNVIVLKLLNGDIPRQDEMELKVLGRQALLLVFDALENESEYDYFQVEFVEWAREGELPATLLKPFEYRYDEIRVEC